MKKSIALKTKLMLAFRKLLRSKAKTQKDNHLSFKKLGYTTFLSAALVALLGFNQNAHAQTTLAAGDVAIIAINPSGTDAFAFVLLKDITANTVIRFTDNGFDSPTAGRTGEGFLTYTAPSAKLAGTLITWANGQVITGTGWDSNNPINFALNASGEQLFAFQGSTANWGSQSGITLLFGIDCGNSGGFITSGSAAAGTSYQPSAMTLGTNLVTMASSNGNVYFANGTSSQTSVTVSGTQLALLSLFANSTKYFKSSSAITFPTYSITVNTCIAPAISSITSNSPICANGTLNLSVSATGTATLGYAWTGAGTFNSTSVSNPSVTGASTGTYSVTVTNGCGSSTSSTNVTVNANITPSVSIAANPGTTICSGTNVTFTATPTNGGTPSYQWKLNGNNVGTNSNTYSNSSLTNNDVVTCVMTSTATCAAPTTATSNALTMTVNTNVTPSVSIAVSSGTAICAGTNVTVSATAINGGTTPNYEFFVNSVSIQSGSSNTYSSNSFTDNDAITCILTSNADCQTSSTSNSNTLTITVTTSVTPAISIAGVPGNVICAGTNITFTATPTNGGSTPSYQWKLNGNDVGTYSDTYSNNALANNDMVTCVMTSSNGCASPTTATSNSITITVTPNVTPSVTIGANPGNTICSGTSVTFTAIPVNGGTPSYQWTKNGNNVGTNSLTYTDASLANSDVIACSVTSSETCATTSTVVSNTITMTVNPVPTPTTTGALSFCTGGSTTLDAGAGYASYLWSTNETSEIISATTAGTYTVTVSNGTCTGTSAPVTVIQISSPSQPGAFTVSSANVNNGQNGVVFTVPNVAGVTYSWSYSGTGATINGTGNSVTVNFSMSTTGGTLGVTATNICGTSAARIIAITVTLLPDMRITEYMYNGGGAGGAGEFVEFTNIGSTPIDMTGWSFDDNSRSPGSQSLTTIGTVQPGESVILTELNAGTFRTNWNLCNGVKVIGGNANNLGREDEINLYDASNNLVDRLTYGDQTFSPGSIRTTLKSGWVSAAGLGANNITQWTLSAMADAEASFTSTLAEIGSPGKSTRATVVFDPCVIVNGVPTIVMDVLSTTNYLDGGVLVSPPTPYGISGVIGDITNPASTLGVDFTINDDVTPVGSLTVTVASSNLTVVPNANIILTGSGASRNLKITPAAVGYSNITVTVNDGTNSTSFVINYAASDPSPNIIPANTFWHTGMSDGSDAIALDNSYYVSGDDELNILNVYSRSASGLSFASYNYTSNLALPDPSKPEVDVEAATRSTANANKVYWTGSMSNGKSPFDNKPNRDRLFATTVTGTGAATSFSFNGYVNVRTALLAWGDANGYNFTASAAAGVDSKALNGFSLEGMVFGPDNTTMYLGLRAPLVPTTFRHNAVIAPILNFEVWFNNGSPSGPPTFGPPIELDLNTTGIRDIIRLSNGTYVILSGSPIDQGGVNHMYKWTGNPTDAPVEIITSSANLLNWEGIMQVNDSTGGTLSLSKLQIISDGGAQILYQDNNEAKDLGDLNLRKFRSDVITGLNLNMCSGFTASVTQSGSTALCADDSVTLTASAGNSYLWSTGATTQTIKIGLFGSGTYTVTVMNAIGCSASPSQTVTVTKALPSDFNGDNVTNNIDFLQLLGKFNQSCTCPEDLNHDGVVNNIDFLVLLGEFNHICGGGSFQ